MEPLRSLVRHRGLLWQFTARNVEIRHRGSVLGVAWAVLNPLLVLALYVFVFGYIFGGSFGVRPDETKWEFGLGVFVGLAIFHLISEAIATAPGIIVSNQNFVKKVVFPLEVLPAAAVGASTIHMAITFGLVIIGVLLGGGHLSITLLLLPLVVLPMIGLALGLTWFLAALGVFFRDIGQIVGALTSALLFASAIFYPAAQIQSQAPAAWAFLRFNPLIHAVEMARGVILWGQYPPVKELVLLNMVGAAAALIGLLVFARLKGAFADVV